MQHFENLTRSGQIRRMKRLAETALASYNLGDVHLTPLGHFFNTTFRIDVPVQPRKSSQHGLAACKAERYVIRIHRPGSQSPAAIQSELLWLQALRYEAGLVVPEPMSTSDGTLVTTVSTPGVPEPRHCVLFCWVDGRFLHSQLNAKALERVGIFMAKLHRHAEGFVVPPGFYRTRWDYEGLRGKALGTDLEKSWAHLSQEARNILDTTGERVQETMQCLGEGREVFGLIHADFYERNYLFSKRDVHAIDFDGCGWGYYLFDIGVTFSTLLAHPDYPWLRKAFLQGYRQIRQLSASHEALIDTFIAGRLMCHILWLAAHVDEPSYGKRAIRRIEYEIEELKGLSARPICH